MKDTENRKPQREGLPVWVTVIVVPILVNLASAVIYDLLKVWLQL